MRIAQSIPPLGGLVGYWMSPWPLETTGMPSQIGHRDTAIRMSARIKCLQSIVKQNQRTAKGSVDGTQFPYGSRARIAKHGVGSDQY